LKDKLTPKRTNNVQSADYVGPDPDNLLKTTFVEAEKSFLEGFGGLQFLFLIITL